jgi:hypothetical protein
MSQTLSPASAMHVRASRFAQRERPAATIPSRIRTTYAFERAPVSQRPAASPAELLLFALRGAIR